VGLSFSKHQEILSNFSIFSNEEIHSFYKPFCIKFFFITNGTKIILYFFFVIASPHHEKRAAYPKKSHRQNSFATSSSTGQADSAEAASHGNGVPHGNVTIGKHHGKRESAAGKLLLSFG
jgi:hypothetical protein